jgi:hypothetical protein
MIIFSIHPQTRDGTKKGTPRMRGVPVCLPGGRTHLALRLTEIFLSTLRSSSLLSAGTVANWEP